MALPWPQAPLGRPWPCTAVAGGAGGRWRLGSTASSVSLANGTRHQGLGAIRGTGPQQIGTGTGGRGRGAEGRGRGGRGQGQAYQQVLLLELGDPELALLPVFLDGLLDTRIEGVELHLPLFLLFQSVLENVQADDDKLVLVGEAVKEAAAGSGAHGSGGPSQSRQLRFGGSGGDGGLATLGLRDAGTCLREGRRRRLQGRGDVLTQAPPRRLGTAAMRFVSVVLAGGHLY